MNNVIRCILAIYVDDILISGKIDDINLTKSLIKRKFNIKDCQDRWFQFILKSPEINLKSFTNKTLHFNKNNINKISASCYAWQIIFWIFLIIKNKVFIFRNDLPNRSFIYFYLKAFFSRYREATADLILDSELVI